MKKLFSLGILILLIVSVAMVSAKGSGSIWTTRNDCGDITQDENHYNIGETIYLNGANFDEGTYEWNIKGLGGSSDSGASCNPNTVVASETYTVDSTGTFCFAAYTVQEGDCGGYKATFDKKQDNYRVVPEFGVFVGALTLLSALGIFFAVRRS